MSATAPYPMELVNFLNSSIFPKMTALSTRVIRRQPVSGTISWLTR